MPSEFERLQSELAATESASEKPEATLGEKAAAFGQGALDIIPGAKAGIAKGLSALNPGSTPQDFAQLQDELSTKAGGYETAGNIAGAVGAGILTGGVGTAGGLVVGALKSGAAAAAMQPIYRLGEAAHQAQAQGDPLRVEQIEHALLPDWDTAQAALIAGVLHLGAGSLGKMLSGVQPVAEKLAVKSASKGYSEAAETLGRSKERIARTALDQGLLNGRTTPTSLVGRLRDAESTIESVTGSTAVDMPLQEKLVKVLTDQAQKAGSNAELASTGKRLQQQAELLTDLREPHQKMMKPFVQQTGQQIEGIIQSLSKDVNNPQAKQLLDETQLALRGVWGEHIKNVNPEGAAQYSDAVANHKMWSAMKDETAALVDKQATMGDIGKAAAITGAGFAAGKLFGPGGGVVGAGLAAAREAFASGGTLKSKSYANLFDRFSKSPPLATFFQRSENVIDTLLGKPAPLYAAKTNSEPRDMNEYYDQVSSAARQIAANPQPFTDHLSGQLGFLPSHEADPITASVTNKFIAAATELPDTGQPPTIFGVQTQPTDRAKRAFLSKFEAKFDPYKAVLSGNAELIAEADKHYPKTMAEIRKKLIDRISQPNVPYSTRRQISAILGVAGVPTQDPALAAQLQIGIQNSRQAKSNAGQMDSARQQHAALKNNQATLTRANSLSKGLDE